MELKQSDFLRGARTLELAEDSDTLVVRSRDGRVTKELPIELNVLHDKPSRVQQKATSSLVIVCLAFIVGLIFLIAGLLGRDASAQMSSSLFGIFMFGAGLASFARMRRMSGDVLVFYSRFNGQVAFTLYHNKPDADSFQAFVTVLCHRIKLAHEKIPSIQQEISVPAQIEQYARLAKDGVITQIQFDEVRRSLLGSVTGGAKPIGFHH
jgi:hypothetical protein